MTHASVPARRFRVRRLAAIVGAVGIVAGMTTLVPAASAAPSGPSVSVPSTTTLGAGSRLMLDGFSISGASGNVTAIVSTNGSATLSIQPLGANPGPGSGVTISSGYSWTGSNVIRFSGTQSAVNDALEWLWIDGATTGATVSLFAQEEGSAQNVVYSPDSGHFYEYVAAPGITWTNAKAAAEGTTFGGEPGYLAQVSSSAVNTFIKNKIPGATSVWIGARASMYTPGSHTDGLEDTDVSAGPEGTPRNWQWIGGPLNRNSFTVCTSDTGSGNCTTSTTLFCTGAAPYANWKAGEEPNNWEGTGERYAVTNWGGANGFWNDLPNSTTGISGYVIEYGGSIGSPESCNAAATFTDIPLATTTLAVAGDPAATVPDAPVNLTAAPGDSSLRLTFGAPLSDGGSPVIAYSYSLDNGTTWLPLGTSGSGPFSATITGLTNDTDYTVKVRAINAVGVGAAAQVGPVTPVEAPPAPARAPTTSTPVTTATPTSSPAPTTSTPVSTTKSSKDTTSAETSIPTNNIKDPVTFTSTTPPPAPPALPGVSEVNDSSASQLDLSENTVPRSGTFNAVATGFLPGSVVDFYIWSEPVYLGSAIADVHGVAVLPVTLGSEYIGDHHVQSVGTGLLGEPRNLAQPITVVDQLASTGPDVTIPLVLGLQLLIAGIAMVRLARRRLRGASPAHI